jgi:hypothetical protein
VQIDRRRTDLIRGHQRIDGEPARVDLAADHVARQYHEHPL